MAAQWFKSLVGQESSDAHPSSSSVVHVSDAEFSDVVLKSTAPVLVDFWAPWCGPCRLVGPTVEELASEYAGKAVVAKINTDENTRVASQLGIRGIPTLIFFKDGKEVDRVVGLAPKRTLKEKLDSVLA